MSETLRKAHTLRAINNLFNSLLFAISYAGIALTMFLFSPENMIVCTGFLVACCIVLLITSGSMSKRRKKTIRIPLLVLALAGMAFAGWGTAVIVRTVVWSQVSGGTVITGLQFLFFGMVAFMSGLFAKN